MSFTAFNSHFTVATSKRPLHRYLRHPRRHLPQIILDVRAVPLILFAPRESQRAVVVRHVGRVRRRASIRPSRRVDVLNQRLQRLLHRGRALAHEIVARSRSVRPRTLEILRPRRRRARGARGARRATRRAAMIPESRASRRRRARARRDAARGHRARDAMRRRALSRARRATIAATRRRDDAIAAMRDADPRQTAATGDARGRRARGKALANAVCLLHARCRSSAIKRTTSADGTRRRRSNRTGTRPWARGR